MSKYIWEIDIDQYLENISGDDIANYPRNVEIALKKKFNVAKQEIISCLNSTDSCIKKIKYVMQRELLLNFILFEYNCDSIEKMNEFDHLFNKESKIAYVEAHEERMFEYEKFLIINQI